MGERQRDSIVIIYEDSLYGRRRALAEWMGAWFDEKGYRVVYGTYRDGVFQGIQISAEQFRLIITMDFAGFELLTVNQESWLGCQTCLCDAMIYDSPLPYRTKLVRQMAWNTLLDCYDGHSAEYLETYFSHTMSNVKTCIPPVPIPDSVLPLCERDVEVFLPVAYEPSAEIAKRLDAMDGIFRDVAERLKEAMYLDRQLSLQDALKSYLDSVGFTCDKEEFVTILEMMTEVISYVRARQIEELMEALLDIHAHITVCGPGWSASAYSRSSYVKVLGGDMGLPFQTMQEVMGRAKFVVHPQTMLRRGIHERALLAMANGAVVITEQLPVLAENFVDGTEILFYIPRDMKEKLRGYLKETDEEYLQRMADYGRKKAASLSDIGVYMEHILKLGEID